MFEDTPEILVTDTEVRFEDGTILSVHDINDIPNTVDPDWTWGN